MVGKSVSLFIVSRTELGIRDCDNLPHVTSIIALGLAELVKTKTVPFVFLFCFVFFSSIFDGIKSDLACKYQ